jgi:hypothetical protein
MTMSPERENGPAVGPDPQSGKANPTPLDVLFILAASVVLLLLLLWMATSIAGHPLFTDLPPWLKSIVSELWTKVLVGSAGAGAGILALRKYIFQSRPSLNYMIWIPATTFGLIIALFAVEQLVTKPEKPPQKTATLVHVPIRFGAELPNKEGVSPNSSLPPIRVAVVSPNPKDQTEVIDPDAGDPDYPYHGDVDEMPTLQDIKFVADLNPILGGRWEPSVTGHVWRICLKANPKKPFPAPDTPEAQSIMIKLKCLAKGNCPRASNDPSPAVACEEQVAGNLGLLPAVYAAELDEQSPQPGWVVPSLDSLKKVPALARPGYTQFNVKFTPEGKAREADRYYYAVKVNEQPVYIDGFLPDRIIFPLQPGPNWISFALENLNFTGQDNGYENLHLSITFLKGSDVVHRQELDRKYIALRDAAPIPPFPTEAGTFGWTGKYIVPKNEDVYEILVGSSVCATAEDQECVKRIMNAKREFDAASLTFNDKPVVVQVRPPVRPIPLAYGLALGVVLPSREVKFTFSSTETDQFCHWAAEHYGQGTAGKIIQKDRRRYDVATMGYGPCD